MKLSSPVFSNNQYMPAKYTCEGEGVSPAFNLEEIPARAKSLALIADDPDAPGGSFVHWVVFNIPAAARIEENTVPGTQGVNTAGSVNYCSPCPPTGTHRYFFKVYALDAQLNLGEGITKQELEKAMQGHILAQAELIGLYQRRQR